MASVDQRSAADIKREIDEERDAITRMLDDIHDRLSFESLSSELVGNIRDQSGEIGKSVMRGARDNPVPVALAAAAAGLAWLALNRRNARDSQPRAALMPASSGWDGAAAAPRRDLDPFGQAPRSSRWDLAREAYAGGREAVTEAMNRLPPGTKEAAIAAGIGLAGQAAQAGLAAAQSGLSSAGQAAQSGLSSAGQAAQSGLSAAGQAAQSGLSAAQSGLSAAGHAAQSTAASLGQRFSGAYASTADLRERITHGTEGLSRQARERVIAARTRAYEAQLRAEHYAVRGREKAVDFYDEQPLVAGALALAVGAALGGLLPRLLSRESGALGAYRDHVFEEAERIYREEQGRVDESARDARDAAQRVGDRAEAGATRAGDLGRTSVEEIEKAADRAAEKVREEVERQKRGRH